MYRKLAESADDVLGYAIEGRVTADEVEQMQSDMQAAIDRHGSFRLLIRMDQLEGVEPTAVWQDLKMVPDYVRHIDRLAVVGDARWHDWVTTLGDAFSEAASFAPDEMERAWAWVRGPAEVIRFDLGSERDPATIANALNALRERSTGKGEQDAP